MKTFIFTIMMISTSLCIHALNSDYYFIKAEKCEREAEYYQRLAEQYERDIKFYQELAERYMRDVEYFTALGRDVIVTSRHDKANNALMVSRRSQDMAADAWKKAEVRTQWAKEALEKAQELQKTEAKQNIQYKQKPKAKAKPKPRK